MSTRHTQHWPIEQVQTWFDAYPWICGFNYLPASAVNFLEMWMADTFDPKRIDRELGWAADAGFNAARVNLHFLVWHHDRAGLLDRMRQFLDIAWAKGIYTVFVLFDDCGFGGQEPQYGPQQPPIPNLHNSRAVASPGRAMVMDPTQWDGLGNYVRDIVGQFAQDHRLLFWDLYNEPGNRMIFETDGFREYDPALEDYSERLLVQAFDWARSAAPSQPLTVGAWRTAPVGSGAADFDNPIDQAALALSDIVTFHAYVDRPRMEKCINTLATQNRPMFLTEWMARAVDSRIETQLDLLHYRHVGCFNWGMVQGRTQTHLPWPRPLLEQHGINPDETIWFHDIFWPDGRPYDPVEIQIINSLTQSQKRSLSAE